MGMSGSGGRVGGRVGVQLGSKLGVGGVELGVGVATSWALGDVAELGDRFPGSILRGGLASLASMDASRPRIFPARGSLRARLASPRAHELATGHRLGTRIGPNPGSATWGPRFPSCFLSPGTRLGDPWERPPGDPNSTPPYLETPRRRPPARWPVGGQLGVRSGQLGVSWGSEWGPAGPPGRPPRRAGIGPVGAGIRPPTPEFRVGSDFSAPSFAAVCPLVGEFCRLGTRRAIFLGSQGRSQELTPADRVGQAGPKNRPRPARSSPGDPDLPPGGPRDRSPAARLDPGGGTLRSGSAGPENGVAGTTQMGRSGPPRWVDLDDLDDPNFDPGDRSCANL